MLWSKKLLTLFFSACFFFPSFKINFNIESQKVGESTKPSLINFNFYYITYGELLGQMSLANKSFSSAPVDSMFSSLLLEMCYMLKMAFCNGRIHQFVTDHHKIKPTNRESVLHANEYLIITISKIRKWTPCAWFTSCKWVKSNLPLLRFM